MENIIKQLLAISNYAAYLESVQMQLSYFFLKNYWAI